MPCPDLFRTHRKTLERYEPPLLPRGFPVNGGGEETGICERRLHLEPIGCNEQNPLRLTQEKGFPFILSRSSSPGFCHQRCLW